MNFLALVGFIDALKDIGLNSEQIDCVWNLVRNFVNKEI